MFQPQFQISNKILRQIGVVEAAKEVIDHAPLLPYYEKKFQDEAVVRSVHHGTRIEGNELDLDETEQVLAGRSVVARERDIQEVINYREAIKYIESDKRVLKEGVTDGLIKELHRLTVNRVLPPGKSGDFRKTPVVVKNSQTGETTYKPPLAISVPFMISDLIAYINSASEKDIHPVLKSGVVHYEFVRIHPFVDGNGRVGRLLSTFILYLEGYDIRRFFSLEEYFDSDPLSYYQALQSVEKHDGDMTYWLEYFTEGLAIELNRIKNKIERISIDGKLRERLGGEPLLLSERQLKIIEYIQKTGHLQNSGFGQLFPMVSEDTVLNELKTLISSGIVKKVGKTKAARYTMA